MCKGKKSIWMVLFLYLPLDTLKLCVSLGRCCQLESFSCCKGVSSRHWPELACFFGREVVGDWVNLLFTCLGEQGVLIAVAGFREPNRSIISASFAGCLHSVHWGLLGCYWALDRKMGVVPGVSQPSNLLLTCSGHVGNWLIKQVKGIFSWEAFQLPSNHSFEIF